MADIEKSDRIGSNVPTDIDNEPAKAIQLLRETAVEGTQVHETDHIRLRWKIDMTLMPLLCITYALQSIDKTTLGYAAVFGLSDDTHLVGTQYSWASALFYLGYLVWEYPTNLLLQRLPINLFMAGTVRLESIPIAPCLH